MLVQILLAAIHTPAYYVEVKVTDLEILCLSFVSKFLRSERQAQVQVSCPVLRQTLFLSDT